MVVRDGRRTSAWYVGASVVNLALGYLAVYPLAALEFAAATRVRLAIRLPVGAFYPSDGLGFLVLVALIAGVPLLVAYLVVNALIVRRVAAPRWSYWLLSALVVLLPYLAALVWPASWGLIGYRAAG